MKRKGQIEVAARAGLLEVQEVALGHDARGEVGAGDARAFLGHLHGLAGHLELATAADGRLQTVGQAQREGRDVGRVHDAGGGADVEADGQVEGRDGDGLRLLGEIESPLGLGQRDLGAQDLLALDDASLGQLPGHVQVVLRAADGLRGDAVQRPGPQHLVVGHRHVVGDRLVGTLGLELGDVHGEAGLVVTAQTPPEVADEPLEFQLGHLEAGLAVQADGNRAKEGKDGEVGRIRDPRDREPDPARLNVVAPRQVAAGHGRQKSREGDVLPPLGLLDALQGRPQPGLEPERHGDARRAG